MGYKRLACARQNGKIQVTQTCVAQIHLEGLKTTARWNVGSAKVGLNIVEQPQPLRLISLTTTREQLTSDFFYYQVVWFVARGTQMIHLSIMDAPRESGWSLIGIWKCPELPTAKNYAEKVRYQDAVIFQMRLDAGFNRGVQLHQPTLDLNLAQRTQFNVGSMVVQAYMKHQL